MQCSNNLKQFGLALHNYADTHKVFPPRRGGSAGGGNAARFDGNYDRKSAFIFLLPFLEQTALNDMIQAGGVTDTNGNVIWPGGPAGWYGNANWIPWRTQLSVVLCPSDKPTLGGNQAKHSYSFCIGDSPGNPSVNADRWNIANTTSRGMFGGSQRCRTFSHITDGTSNTIGMSERCWGGNPANGGRAASITANGQDQRVAHVMNVASVIANPSSCLAQAVNKRYVGVTIKTVHGALWSDGQAESVGFTTILPPNSPSCAADAAGGADAQGGVLSASSYHPGGVQVVLMDGSVRFVSETINSGDTSRPYVNAGPSPYGVWGALGSVDGGETVSEF